jgi:dihydroxyacid dehydratase/phosphogluconate dehydratase
MATILKESGTMWRRKATLIGVLWLTAGCAAIPDRRASQVAGIDARKATEVALEGCLRLGTAPGTFVLTDVTGVARGSSTAAVDVMSTRVGLTAHVGRRVAVLGQQQVTPSRSIHDGATLFAIRLLNVVEAECRTSG